MVQSITGHMKIIVDHTKYVEYYMCVYACTHIKAQTFKECVSGA